MTPKKAKKEGSVNREEERTAKELRNLDAASAKLKAEANKLDAEARKLEAEVRKFDQTAYADAVKLGLAVFATILAALKVADTLGWI